MSNTVIYIVCVTHQEFFDYQNQNPDLSCTRIFDGNTLRGLGPGKIIRIGNYHELWNIQEIEESIDIYEPMWNEHLVSKEISNQVDQQSEDNILGYGV